MVHVCVCVRELSRVCAYVGEYVGECVRVHVCECVC